MQQLPERLRPPDAASRSSDHVSGHRSSPVTSNCAESGSPSPTRAAARHQRNLKVLIAGIGRSPTEAITTLAHDGDTHLGVDTAHGPAQIAFHPVRRNEPQRPRRTGEKQKKKKSFHRAVARDQTDRTSRDNSSKVIVRTRRRRLRS